VIKVYTGTHPVEVVKKAMAEAEALGCYVESFSTVVHSGQYCLTVLLIKDDYHALRSDN